MRGARGEGAGKALQAAVRVAQDFRGAGGQSTTIEAASEGRGCKRAGGVSLGGRGLKPETHLPPFKKWEFIANR